MKKRYLLLILCLLCSVTTFSQKLYVWCPEDQNINQREYFLENETVAVVVFDSRTIPDKSKIECTRENVLKSIQENIKKAYPSAVINQLDDSEFHKKSEDGSVTIKIDISAYHAGFGKDINVAIGSVGGEFSFGFIPKGKWNALTRLNVTIFDNRNDSKQKYSDEIMEIESKSNMLGYKSAKDCLKVTYATVIQRMLSFIDKSLME